MSKAAGYQNFPKTCHGMHVIVENLPAVGGSRETARGGPTDIFRKPSWGKPF